VIKSVLILSWVTLIAGCSGSMNGVLRESGEQVSFSRYAGLCLDSLQVTLPDGETFIGYITIPESDGEVDPFCLSPYQEKSPPGAAVSAGKGSDSVLFSDRLNMMRCELTFQKSGRWSAANGEGICRLSDSRVIDVQ